MTCSQALQVQAYVDGELDALAAAAVEGHLETCAECRALRAGIEELRKGIRESAPYYRASDALRERIRASLDDGHAMVRGARSRRPFWLGAASGAAATALAASLVVSFFIPTGQNEIAGDVVSAHLRSLMGTHLIDVASSNHHVVKPWFAGRVDISPPVEDFAKNGFDLVGGRVDYVDGERAAVLVYRHGAHVVNVFAWKDDGKAREGAMTLDGYHLLSWKNGGIFFCAVSDAAEGELDRLENLIRENRAG